MYMQRIVCIIYVYVYVIYTYAIPHHTLASCGSNNWSISQLVTRIRNP